MFFADDDVVVPLNFPKVLTISGGTDVDFSTSVGLVVTSIVLRNPNGLTYSFRADTLPAGINLGTGFGGVLVVTITKSLFNFGGPGFIEGVWSAVSFLNNGVTINQVPGGDPQYASWQWGGNVANAIEIVKKYLTNRIEPNSDVTPTGMILYDDDTLTPVATRTIANSSGSVNPEQILKLGPLVILP
jgi:hypothetical protein